MTCLKGTLQISILMFALLRLAVTCHRRCDRFQIGVKPEFKWHSNQIFFLTRHSNQFQIVGANLLISFCPHKINYHIAMCMIWNGKIDFQEVVTTICKYLRILHKCQKSVRWMVIFSLVCTWHYWKGHFRCVLWVGQHPWRLWNTNSAKVIVVKDFQVASLVTAH